MSDIICAKCGEPWHTRGLHFSHTDLSENDFEDLLAGECCPACIRLDKLPTPETILAWQGSIQRVSEGRPEWQYLTDSKVPACAIVAIPSIGPFEATLMGDLSISYWLQEQLDKSHNRDIVDMLNDTEVLLRALNERLAILQHCPKTDQAAVNAFFADMQARLDADQS